MYSPDIYPLLIEPIPSDHLRAYKKSYSLVWVYYNTISDQETHFIAKCDNWLMVVSLWYYYILYQLETASLIKEWNGL